MLLSLLSRSNMATQQESKIEDFAFDYLKAYYLQHLAANNILVGQDEKTKRGETADGMLVFKKSTGKAFVSIISLQQSVILVDLLLKYKSYGLGKLRFLSPLVLAALCFLLGKSIGNLLVMLVVPVVVAPLTFMLHTHLRKSYLRRRVETLVDKVTQLPADEQWIGLSISSLIFRNNPLANILLETCSQKGVGLITVGKRNKVILMQRPQHKACRRGDHLSHYLSEANSRRAMNDDHVLRVA